jgi:hypothetical protein
MRNSRVQKSTVCLRLDILQVLFLWKALTNALECGHIIGVCVDLMSCNLDKLTY